jgi:hypothetical protein
MDDTKKKKILKKSFQTNYKFTIFVSDLLRQHNPDYIRIFKDDEELDGIILYKQETLEGEILWTCCLTRIGNIHQGSRVPPQNKTRRMLESVRHVLNKIFIVNETTTIRTDRLIIVTNGYIAENAKKEILTNFPDAVIIFWDLDKLQELTTSKWAHYFENKEPIVIEYSKNLKRKLEDISKELLILYYNKQVKKLWDIFINLQLVETKIETKILSLPAEKIKESNRKSQNYIDDSTIPFKDISKQKFKIDEILETGRDIIIIGDFGSGKSTIMKRICFSLISHAKNTEEVYKIPVLLNCREMCNFNFDLITHVKNEFTSLTGGKEINFENQLLAGRIVLLLDGLEEDFEEHGDKILDAVSNFKKLYPSVQLIIATRPIGLLDIEPLFENFRRFEILPLDYGQIAELLEKWYPTNIKQTSQLINALKKTSLVISLPRTPLAITLLAIIFEDEEKVEEIPANITELYSKFTEVFTGRWDKEKGISSQDKYGIKSHLIRQLAFEMHYNNRLEISKENLAFFVEKYKVSKGYDDISNEELLDELLKRNPLIVEYQNSYKFIHLSFQEYYASYGIMQSNDFVRDAERYLIENFLNSWWSNVVLFYVGSKKDCPEFIVELSRNAIALEIDERYLKLDNLGKVMQAAISTDVTSKVTVLSNSLDTLDKFRNDLLNLISTDPLFNKSLKRQGVSELSLIMLLKDIFLTSYKSKYLKAAMIEVFERKHVNGISNLAKYVLSSTLTKLTKNPDFLLEFSNDQSVTLEWRYLAKSDLEKFEKNFDKNQLKMYKSLDRKIKKGRAYLISAFRRLRALPRLKETLKQIEN